VIHSVYCADMKRHPLVPEKPECRPALAVLSSEMLAGDRQALSPRSWLGPRTPLLYDATTQERDAIQISIAVQGSVKIIQYGLRMPSNTVLRSSFAESMSSASFIFETKPTVNGQANFWDSVTRPTWISDCSERHSMRWRLERRGNGVSESQRYQVHVKAERSLSLLIQSFGMIKPNE
jgi:hypothetical protein